MTKTLHPPTPGTRTAIRATGLTRRFGSVTALDRLDLEIPAGCFFVLVGRNGAGKTTLMETILGFGAPQDGTLECFGLLPHRKGAEVRAAIGYLPEGRAWPYPRMSGAAFLSHEAAFRTEWDPEWAERLCNTFEVPLRQRVEAMSKGEFRRLRIVAALAHRPPLLLLDEPSDGLDPIMRERLHETLAEQLSERETTVLAATHRPEELAGFAERLGVLRAGRMDTVLRRERMDREGLEVRVRIPDGVDAGTISDLGVLRREGQGPEELWHLLADPDTLSERCRGAGIEIVETRPLGVRELAIALLEASR